jgi:hypothetical protein
MALLIFTKFLPVLCLTIGHGHFRILSAGFVSCLTNLAVSVISFLGVKRPEWEAELPSLLRADEVLTHGCLV